MLAKSPVGGKPPNRLPLIPSETASSNFGNVLTFQQAMSGVVSPQYTSTTPLMHSASTTIDLDMLNDTALSSVLENANDSLKNLPFADSPTADDEDILSGGSPTSTFAAAYLANSSSGRMSGVGASAFVGGSSIIHGSSVTVGQYGSRQRQRLRTSSMPAESRKV